MSNSILNVAAISIDIAQGKPDENMSAVGRSLELLDSTTDLVVLPELFSTGYVADPAEAASLAQSNGGSTMSTLHSLAAKYNLAIAGTFLASTGHRIYNRAFFIEPSGDDTYYDKHHLFSLSNESKIYTQGTANIPIVRYRAWNIAMIICYDLRFPVWSRNVDNAYDMLLVPANWPTVRSYAWQHLLIARAIENQCCVVGANRSGSDQYGVYDDQTFILDATGHSVGSRLSRRSAPAPIITASLSLSHVEHTRRRMPAIDSADRFTIS